MKHSLSTLRLGMLITALISVISFGIPASAQEGPR